MSTYSPLVKAARPTQLVQNSTAMQACLKVLGASQSLAFDLEFDSHRHAYGVTLCLIQVATPDACFIIDPMADIDLAGLYEAFNNPLIEKIVHSPGEDLRLLHSLGCYPQNVFDTEVVAKLLNYEQTSLSALLQIKLGYSLNKDQQRSNWLRRPLTTEQIEYAVEDVAGLHTLKESLLAEALPKELMPFIEEEQAALSTTIHKSERKDFFLKSGDVNNLSPYDQHILNSLFLYRDDLARSLNRPAYQVMDEALIRDIASGDVQPEDAPFEKGVYGGYKNDRFGKQLADQLTAIRKEAEDLALSRKKPPREWNSDGRVSKSVMAEQKEAVFVPIQQALVSRFGEHAARFILSNGTVNELLKGTTKIANLKRQYKQELVRQIAVELGIDLGPFE